MTRAQLLPFPGLALVIGLAYILGDQRRTAAPSFLVAKSLAPMWVWGALFVLGATVMYAALATHSPRLMATALLIGGGIFAWWSVLLFSAGVTDPRGSLNAWAAYGFIAFGHYYAAHRIRVRR
ncbi:MAG TPA: hypothetical protein VFH54_06910 [Mycobacteriales bacterium]|nr:hypothetical protein [Mycobacteriales bacterium]